MKYAGRWRLLAASSAAAIALLMGASDASALPRDCPPGYVWDANQGSCIKKKVTPRRSPAQKYYRGLDLLNGTKKRAPRPALGLRLLRQACAQRYGQACTSLGFLYLNGRHVKASNASSLKFYAKGCKHRDSNGCIGAADIHSRGVLGKVDHKASIPLLESACKLKHGKGCYNLALKHWDALGTKSNTKRARELFKKAADLLKDDCPKNGPSCHLIGVLYKNGRGVTRSRKRAFELFKAGCDARSGDACYELGNAQKRGHGTAKNIKQAKETYHLACHSFDNANACHDIGVLLVSGTVKAADRRRVMKYGERACQLDKRHCDVIAYLYGTGKGGVKDDKKAVKWYAEACKHGSRVSCYSLGARYYYGTGTPKNIREAVRLFQRSCDRGYGAACTQLGRFYQRGVKGDAYALKFDRARAHRLFLVGCLRRHAEACYLVAYQLENGEAGRGRRRNPRRARIYYSRSCRYNYGVGCAALGRLYARGLGGARNLAKARSKFQRGCSLRSWTACKNLGQHYYRGRGGQKDELKAGLAFTKACKYGADKPCAWIDALYRRSGATQRQRKRAVSALDSACSDAQPNERACYTLARLFAYGGYIANKNPQRAFQLFKEGCERKYQSSCVQLAHMYRRGIGVVQDAKRAKALFTTQCNGSAPASCAWLGVQLWQENRRKDAVPLFKRACQEKNAVACNMLGLAHFTAQGTVWDVNAAKWAYERSCSHGLPVGCTNSAELYEHGIAVPRNLTKALDLYRKGCTPVSSSGCTGLARFYQRGLGGLTANPQKAQAEYYRGCHEDKGNATACRRLADMFRAEGGKPQRDIEMLYQRSLSLATESAKALPRGKVVLATMYADGIAVVRSPAKALAHYGAACDGYDALGCYRAGKLLMGGAKLEPDYEAAAVRFSRACAAGINDACGQAKQAREYAVNPPKQPKTDKPTTKLPTKPRTKRGCGCTAASGRGFPNPVLIGLAVAVSLLSRRRKIAAA